ncbi:putative membrane protein [Paenibacillus forsythiae]|uniref:Membrane protein n=1 Tax=Paenibacillus forsythiae TaxID=365616 RepID=A0ABU3H521_9BACL|nr:hypothetical protein [Paenibacillus forsythiae]MDT3425922.1 putative membrane protein [Paenibacillus forsythiae]
MEKQENLRLPLKQEGAKAHTGGRFSVGLLWGILISIPLWISLLGWIMSFTK